MADNVGFTPGTGALIAADEIAGVLHQRAKMQFGADGSATDVSATDPMPVTMSGVSTESTMAALVASLDALSAKVSACNTGAVVLDAATLAALETINAVVSGAVTVSNFTDNGLTDAQLRASAVPVSGPFYQETQPVSAAALPLPSGAATEATLSAANDKLPALDGGRIPVVLPPGGGGLTNTELRSTPLEVISSSSQFLEALAFRAMAKLTYTLTGQRVDCGGSSVAVASLPTLALITSLAGLGYNTQNGQGIQQSQLVYQCGFRRNIT